jgi:hypothetical protein
MKKKILNALAIIVVIALASGLAVLITITMTQSQQIKINKQQEITNLATNVNLKSSVVAFSNNTNYRIFIFTDTTGKILNITVR